MALGGPGRVSGCCHGGQLDGGIIADGRHGLKAHIAALDRPLVILFEQERAHGRFPIVTLPAVVGSQNGSISKTKRDRPS